MLGQRAKNRVASGQLAATAFTQVGSIVPLPTETNTVPSSANLQATSISSPSPHRRAPPSCAKAVFRKRTRLRQAERDVGVATRLPVAKILLLGYFNCPLCPIFFSDRPLAMYGLSKLRSTRPKSCRWRYGDAGPRPVAGRHSAHCWDIPTRHRRAQRFCIWHLWTSKRQRVLLPRPKDGKVIVLLVLNPVDAGEPVHQQ